MRTAFIDVDGTLTPAGDSSWVRLTEGLGGSTDRLFDSLGRLLKQEISVEAAIGEVMDNWKTSGPVRRGQVESIFDATPLRPDAVEFIAGIKSAGFEPVILAGSMDLFAASVASRLGVETYLCNAKLEFDGDRLRWFTYDPLQSLRKVIQARDYLRKDGQLPADCIAIGDDGGNDRDLYSFAGRAFCLGDSDDVLPGTVTQVNSLSRVVELLS